MIPGIPAELAPVLSPIYSRPGPFFPNAKKQCVVVAKCQKEPKIAIFYIFFIVLRKSSITPPPPYKVILYKIYSHNCMHTVLN